MLDIVLSWKLLSKGETTHNTGWSKEPALDNNTRIFTSLSYRSFITDYISYIGFCRIRTTDSRLFWALEDGEVGTSVRTIRMDISIYSVSWIVLGKITLLRAPTDLRCWWTFEDVETGAAAEIERGSTTLMPKWATNALQVILSPIRRNQSKRYPEGAPGSSIITGPFSSSQPAIDITIRDRGISNPFSSSQPELNTPILDLGITPPLSSIQPTANAVVTLFDIPFSISESKGLLGPVISVFEALEKVLSAKVSISPCYTAIFIFDILQSAVESNEEWERPVRRLRFYFDTIKYHRTELEKDFKIDGVIPTSKTTLIAPLEKFSKWVCHHPSTRPTVDTLLATSRISTIWYATM